MNEQEYRKETFPDPEEAVRVGVTCTVCQKNLTLDTIYSHTVLQVAVCKKCFNFYGDGNFSVDEDGTDKYCRWCGQGGTLYCCSDCTGTFCKKCIKMNLPKEILTDIEDENWRCFSCNPKPLWYLRGLLSAALECKQMKCGKSTTRKKRKQPKVDETHTSVRCKNERGTRKAKTTATKNKHIKSSDRGEENASSSEEEVFVDRKSTKRSENVSEDVSRIIEKEKRKCTVKVTRKILENFQNILSEASTNVKNLQCILSTENVTASGREALTVFNTVTEHCRALQTLLRKEIQIDSIKKERFSDTCNLSLLSADKEEQDNACKLALLKSYKSSDSADDLASSASESSDMEQIFEKRSSAKKERKYNGAEISKEEQSVTNDNSIATDNAEASEDSSSVAIPEVCDTAVFGSPQSEKTEDNEKKVEGTDSESEINRLTNMSSLRRVKKKENGGDVTSEDSSYEEDQLKNVTVRKRKKFEKQEADEPVDSQLSEDIESDAAGYSDDEWKKRVESSKQSALRNENESLVKKALLMSDSENEEDDEMAEPVKKGEKRKKENKDDDESDSCNSSTSKKVSLKDDKKDKLARKCHFDALLSSRLSMSDSSDDERTLKRLQEEKIRQKNKKQPGSSSDSEGVFRARKVLRVTKKKKIKSSSSSDSSVQTLSSEDGGTSSSESSEHSDRRKKNTARKRRRIKVLSDHSENEDDENTPGLSQSSTGKSGRKNIRKLLDEDEINVSTKKMAKLEEERRKRIEERQKLYNQSFQLIPTEDEPIKELILDFDPETKEVFVSVHPEILKHLKPHQAEGIQFMWNQCFESLAQIKQGRGTGCILAHCMGLGKTLQVIGLAHTLLTHEKTNVKRILVVCPLTTVLNWVNEFQKWLGELDNWDSDQVYHLKSNIRIIERAYALNCWSKDGGVFILGYEMFRSLVNCNKARKTIQQMIHSSLLDPGADVVICDEGHILKNESTAIAKALNKVKTARRIVLTGTPIQNNLKEYYCMVQFVKPNLLGNSKEFSNRFVNPILNGQYVDSTPKDVKLMKRRAHVLHKMLEGTVQRFDYSVLTPFLPQKHEYVILVRLTDVQAQLYEYYLENLSLKNQPGTVTLFQDFQIMRLIWTHPYVMKLVAQKKEKQAEKKQLNEEDSEGSLKDFVVHSSEEESESDTNSSHSTASSSAASFDFLENENENKTVTRNLAKGNQ